MREEVVAFRQAIRAGYLPRLRDEMRGDKEMRELLGPHLRVAVAQLSHLEFMRYCWGRARDMLVGLHTWYMCREIDRAMENFRNGQSTFIITLICFRHGKSEITTRFLPAHFLAEFPDRNSIVTSHSTKKTCEFSRFGRALIRSKKFRELYPEIDISGEAGGVEEWGIEGHEGLSQYYGILSGSAGTGGALIVTDDYFGGREDAESLLMRDKIDEAYSNNIFTRRDDPSINMISVTPWHHDDLVARLERRMRDDPTTTQYKIIRMPYKGPTDETVKELQTAVESETDEKMKADMTAKLERYANGGFLFEQKYSEQWYRDMEASLGGPNGYGTASLMRCSPTLKSGKRFNTSKVKVLKEGDFWERTKGLQFVRAYDLASSTKQINKSDPDWTVGVKMAVRWLPTSIAGLSMAEIYVSDVLRGRWEASARNQRIIDTAIADGLIKIYVESWGQYKDTYNELRTLLQGVRIVKESRCPGDKLVKSECLETIINAGNMYLLEGQWNFPYIDELSEDTAHDDQIDATVIGYRSFSPIKTGFMYQDNLVV